MKQNLRLILMTLLCAVFSTAWGETATLTNAKIVAAGDAAQGYQNWYITDDNGNTWNTYAIKNQHSNATSSYHYLQIKKYASNTAYYIQVPEFESKITSITMTVSSTSQPMTGGGNSATLYFSNSNSTSATGDGVASGTGASSVTIDCSDLDLNTGYITASAGVRIWEIEVTYGTTPSGPKDPDVSFANDPLIVMEGYTATNAITKPSDLPVTYSSSDETIAKVDASTGEVTGIAEGETTITASWAAVENKYNEGSASYTVNVIEAVEPTVYEKVTKVNQLVAGNKYILVTDDGVALSSQLNDNYRSSENVTIVDNTISVTNQVVTVLTLGGDENGWTFLASDNDKYLSWSSGNSLNSSDSPANWLITDQFTLSFASAPERILQYNYNNGNPRFACYAGTQKNAYLYVKSGSATSNKENASVSIDKTELTLAEGEAVTATITTDPSSLVVTYTTSDESVAEVSTSGVVTAKAQGNATITATWAEQTIGETVYRAGNKEFVITVKDPNGKGSFADPYTVAEVIAYNGTVNDVWVKAYIVGYYNNGLTSGTGDAPLTNIALCDNKTGAETENTIPVQLPINTIIRSSLNLQENAGMLGEQVLIKGDITKYFDVNGIKNTDDGYIILPEISSVGYSTAYYSNADLKVQEGTTAYAVTDNGKQLDYISVGDVIPAGVAVVLQGSGAQKFQIVAAPTTTTDFSQYANNNLRGLDVDGTTAGPDDGSYVYYKLAIGTSDEDKGKIGFYWAEANGAAFQSKAHKAYLVLPASGNVVSSYAFDETVGISSPVLNEIKSEGVYTLSGVRVMSDRLPKGIYIVNGKKMVIK